MGGCDDPSVEVFWIREWLGLASTRLDGLIAFFYFGSVSRAPVGDDARAHQSVHDAGVGGVRVLISC